MTDDYLNFLLIHFCEANATNPKIMLILIWLKNFLAYLRRFRHRANRWESKLARQWRWTRQRRWLHGRYSRSSDQIVRFSQPRTVELDSGSYFGKFYFKKTEIRCQSGEFEKANRLLAAISCSPASGSDKLHNFLFIYLTFVYLFLFLQRIAQTSERVVNFKARLITSLI